MASSERRPAALAMPSNRRDAQAPLRYRWVILACIQAGSVAGIVLGVSLGLLMPSITSELRMTPVEQGWLGSSIRIGSALLSVPAAWWLSRYNPRWLMVGGLAAGALAIAGQALAASFGLLLLSRLLYGVALLATSPARIMLIRQWFPLHEVAMANGVATFVIGVTEAAGSAFTPWATDALGGWRPVMWGLALAAASATVLWAIFGGRQAPEDAAPKSAVAEPPAIASLLRYPQLWVVCAGALGGPASWWAFNTFWPAYMLDQFGVSLSVSGFVFGLTSLGMAPGGLLFGWLATRFGVGRPILLACSIVMTLGSLVMLATDSLPLLVLAGSAVGLSWGFVPIVTTLPYHLPNIRPRELAVAGSLVGTAFSLGGVIGPAVAGALLEATGSAFTTLVVLSFGPLTIAAIALGLPETRAAKLKEA
ncbi:MAG: MFS transporter [Chloroflexi bacterium]|nr:MFS transporter [Chloroflexota bacterium]